MGNRINAIWMIKTRKHTALKGNPNVNTKKYLEWCYNSIRKNLGYFHEIVLLDDGSTDDSLSILKTFQGITIVNHKKNRGLSSARNSGIKKSSGEYVAFIDSDIVNNALGGFL